MKISSMPCRRPMEMLIWLSTGSQLASGLNTCIRRLVLISFQAAFHNGARLRRNNQSQRTPQHPRLIPLPALVAAVDEATSKLEVEFVAQNAAEVDVVEEAHRRRTEQSLRRVLPRRLEIAGETQQEQARRR